MVRAGARWCWMKHCADARIIQCVHGPLREVTWAGTYSTSYARGREMLGLKRQ